MRHSYRKSAVNPSIDIIFTPFHTVGVESIGVIATFQVADSARAVVCIQNGIWSPVESTSNLDKSSETSFVSNCIILRV